MTDNSDMASLLNVHNAQFIGELYDLYLSNPGSVDDGWRELFNGIGNSQEKDLKTLQTPNWASASSKVIGAVELSKKNSNANQNLTVESDLDIRRATLNSLRAIMLIRAYQIRGHLKANLDPLKLVEPNPHPELDPSHYGFGNDDWDSPIFIDNALGLETATLREIMEVLEKTYCGSIGVEFMHMQDPAQKVWIQNRIEQIKNNTDFTVLGKKTILERITAAECFEKFLAVKYVGTKRFGLDGAESVIPALEQILKRGSQLGLEEVVVGMAHRGRLNVLCNFMDKPFRAIISEFLGNPVAPEDAGGSGDVKYHKGSSADREFDEKMVHLTLNANPSHLEAVDPVVVGRVRAKQAQRDDVERKKVLGILMHGDAAFAGQGMVAEVFDFSQLRGYRTGGTIHVIINNQIGFTTSPAYSRSSPYSTDVAKMVMAPIFHVNADDAEAVVHVARIATEFRQEFGVDVVCDIIGYRRFGHNEGDEPMFTQPKMYNKIKNHLTTREIYAQRLEKEGIIEPGGGDLMVSKENARLSSEFDAGVNYKPNKAGTLDGRWSGITVAHGEARRGETSVDIDTLKKIGRAMCTVPEAYDLNKKLIRNLDQKKSMFKTGNGVDWATAEALAFGSLLVQGNGVRLSGQDSGRGTFSHRHSVWTHQNTEERYIPLNNIDPEQKMFEVIDSPLSEASVLGFEYGFSQAEPNSLILWEAQFGDFANGAQVIMDQFISSGEDKWLRMSGLVLLLPHGYEGQGPDHSSARLERYLQLCGDDNMQVVNCTTPANYFHVLRRQVRRDFRKPLIIMTPKSLLRHKLCVSELEAMGPGTTFHRVMHDMKPLCKDDKVQKVILCSGKIYYELFEERARLKLPNIFLLRLEQLYPFPRSALLEQLSRFPQAEVVWCQEEPENMGAWTYVDRRIEDVLSELDGSSNRPLYVGRAEAASPATGNFNRHVIEQKKLIDQALKISNRNKKKSAAMAKYAAE